ncbi:Chitinase 1 [Haplosporangium sp. Z 27]|nr:Chitinase 1 [Haplosporangium sp. Z 27]
MSSIFSLHIRIYILLGLVCSLCYAFDPNANNNLVNYWGQNSFGAAGGDKAHWQKPLGDYCKGSESENVIAMAFLHVFNSASRSLPQMDLSNQCDPSSVFPGTSLLHCPDTGVGVKLCQSKGKAILLSLGGAAGSYGFTNDAEAKDFAHMIWNLFLGGSSTTRPLDDAVLDGVDLDIEGGPTMGYTAFVAELRSLFATDPKKPYYISAAPQCPFPDAYLGQTLQTAWIDMVFVQFYNNYCGTQAYGTPNFNFDQWDNWAKTTSINKNVKIYLGVPASRTAANAGYVAPARLQEIVNALRCAYNSFGGVMMWDMSQAYANLDGTLDYSTAISQDMKHSKQVVCGSQYQTASSKIVSSTPTLAVSVPIPSSSIPLSTSLPSSPSSTSSLQPQKSSTGAPPNMDPASTPPWESICAVEGGECSAPWPTIPFICDGYKFAICLYGRWIFQSCAPGAYCTAQGCDIINGPVKSCRELESDSMARAESMKMQMGQTIDRMWNKFGIAVDKSWSDYLGLDYDSAQENPSPPGSQQQPFVIPEADRFLADSAIISYDSEPFLIDFVQLDAGQEDLSFSMDDVNNATAFRTQVRIRTNRNAISPLWWVSFYVKSGQTIHSTSRGTVHQQGLEVFVASDPSKEVENSMVIRFVIEGTKTKSNVQGGDVPILEGNDESFEASSLPDASTARFATKAYHRATTP